jgi:hypothetical protein
MKEHVYARQGNVVREYTCAYTYTIVHKHTHTHTKTNRERSQTQRAKQVLHRWLLEVEQQLPLPPMDVLQQELHEVTLFACRSPSCFPRRAREQSTTLYGPPPTPPLFKRNGDGNE